MTVMAGVSVDETMGKWCEFGYLTITTLALILFFKYPLGVLVSLCHGLKKFCAVSLALKLFSAL